MRNLFTLLLIFSTTISFAQTPSSAKPKPAAAPTQATTTSVATKTVIAYFNYDSLLVLIPGYKEAADSVKYYKVEGDKELAVMQKQLNEKRT